MDVLTLLKNDHKTVGGLLDQAKRCEPGDGRLAELADEIETALTVHATIEEKYFYPTLRDRSEESDDVVDVFEAYTEHELIKRLIALLKSGRQPDEQFKAELQVLAENVRHHVKEEESTIFELARQTLDAEELEELGADMEAAKSRLMRSPSRTNGKRTAARTSPRKKSSRRTARR
jgi:hemerythrin superfamily protein